MKLGLPVTSDKTEQSEYLLERLEAKGHCDLSSSEGPAGYPL